MAAMAGEKKRAPPPDEGWQREEEQATVLDQGPRLEVPRRFNVLLHNDDYTTMDFVVLVLVTVFHHEPQAAETIMLDVHQRGVGVAGTFSFEEAESRAEKTMRLARQHEFPLRCSVEAAG